MMESKELTLQDTIEGMNSEDFKERFKAEYWQLVIRTKKLSAILTKWQKGELEFEPKCPYDTLHRQLVFMEGYRTSLEERALLEGIDLQ